MRWLLFLAKVTFITNVFFVICLFIRHTHFNVPAAASEFVVINGWLMSVLFNALFALAVAFFILTHKPTGVARWLLITNIFCFAFQIVYRIFAAQ